MAYENWYRAKLILDKLAGKQYRKLEKIGAETFNILADDMNVQNFQDSLSDYGMIVDLIDKGNTEYNENETTFYQFEVKNFDGQEYQEKAFH